MKNQPPPPPPLNFDASPASLLENTKKLIDETREAQNKLAQAIEPDQATFANAILPLEHIWNHFLLESGPLKFYKDVSADPELRDASSQAEQLLFDFEIETGMRNDLFNLTDTVLKQGNAALDDTESQHLLKVKHDTFIANGLGLQADSQHQRYKEVQTRLSEVQVQFRKNLVNEDGGIWCSRDELSGLAKELVLRLEAAAAAAAAADKSDNGRVKVPFSNQMISAIAESAQDGNTRKRMFLGHQNRCNENVPLLKEALVLRHKAATMLGYTDHATFRLARRMAKSPGVVNDFLQDLRTRLARSVDEEIHALKEVKRADLDARSETLDSANKLYIWDRQFYSRLTSQNQYSLDMQELAAYFPIQTATQGMLRIFQDLFGLVFVPVESPPHETNANGAEESVRRSCRWHDDVQVYSVWDEETAGAAFVGYLYLDIYTRPGKYATPVNISIQPGFTKPDGSRQYPSTVLICNFAKPSSRIPSLLKHGELTLMFHELGHCIHDLVSKAKYAVNHGTSGSVDFAEAPSQLLEKWCWTPSTLRRLSRHYSYLSAEYLEYWYEQQAEQSKEAKQLQQPPSADIPDPLMHNLLRAKNVHGALYNLRQVQIAMYDMMVHQPPSKEWMDNLDISELWNRLWTEVTHLDGPEAPEGAKSPHQWGNGEATFPHLMNDYDAGMYGYLYSNVLASDIFYTVFKHDPMNKEAGRKYRKMVLERGASVDEVTIVLDYLGRPPKTDGFYQELGLFA